MDVDEQLRGREQVVLVAAEYDSRRRAVDRAIELEHSEVGVQREQRRSEIGKRRAAPGVEATQEQHIDWPIGGRSRCHRRRHRRNGSELYMAGSEAGRAQGCDAVWIDVETFESAAARIEGEVEPGSAGLFGTDAD